MTQESEIERAKKTFNNMEQRDNGGTNAHTHTQKIKKLNNKFFFSRTIR